MVRNILEHFSLGVTEPRIEPFGSGLINNTWLVTAGRDRYILQRINENVFKDPAAIDANICSIGQYLQEKYPDYLFTFPVATTDGKTLVRNTAGSYRLFRFIENSRVYTVLQNPRLAYQAARQFGKFTRLLSGFDATQLQITLPDFHNLVLRYEQFEASVQTADKQRQQVAEEAIRALRDRRSIVETFISIKTNPAFKIRVTHHDTKISNVLFDEHDNGICVIDLDTVMPGYFISDVGDMMRTYLSPAGEEETDFEKIDVREEYFDAIVEGYLAEMGAELSKEEKKYFVFAGKFMAYMQALRFLADYLNNDVYYGASYPLHNFNRAMNQLRLLQILEIKEETLLRRIAGFLNPAS